MTPTVFCGFQADSSGGTQMRHVMSLLHVDYLACEWTATVVLITSFENLKYEIQNEHISCCCCYCNTASVAPGFIFVLTAAVKTAQLNLLWSGRYMVKTDSS